MTEGYSGTSIGAIAAEAGVAVPTVYASLRSKANILRAVVELTVRGDDEAAPLASRAGWQEIERQEDPRAQLALFARISPWCATADGKRRSTSSGSPNSS